MSSSNGVVGHGERIVGMALRLLSQQEQELQDLCRWERGRRSKGLGVGRKKVEDWKMKDSIVVPYRSQESVRDVG